ncbi:MAG: hypothetical protein BKP49_02285 [Treponema sp. CETP13]|nr:MAG: hypothetical protein BKP49_02285 [Treponema sp. CETP13]
MIINCDWHIHSCVSPCASLEMSPSAIVKKLQEKNIQLAALTDHNTTKNCPAFAVLCKKAHIAALYGMELQTSEEIHVLCLFSNLQTAMKFGERINTIIPFFQNKPEKYGDQVYVDENDNILGEINKYLQVSASLSIDDTALLVHGLGGLCIPAHVNRSAFSMTSQLGSVVPGEWDALEVMDIPPTYVLSSNLSTKVPLDTLGYPLITSSDAHYLNDIAKRFFNLEIGYNSLYHENGTVNLNTIRRSLKLRPTK